MSAEPSLSTPLNGGNELTKLRIEEERLGIERRKFDAELEKLELEKKRLQIKNEKLAIERRKLSYNERFRNISTGIQSIAVALAAVIGGVFAYIKYIQVESPEAQELKRKAHLEIAIDIEKKLDQSESRVITGILVAKNVGNGIGYVDISKGSESIYVTKVDFDNDGIPVSKTKIYKASDLSVYYRWTNYVVGPNDTIKMAFSIKVDEAGLYAVTAVLPMDDRDIVGKRVPGINYMWHTTTLTKVD